MAGFAGDFEHEAIGEAEGGMLAKEIEGGLDDIGVLQNQAFVAQEHIYGLDYAFNVLAVVGIEIPYGFGQRKQGHPGTVFDK